MLTLVILAAGIGRRYDPATPKQLEAVGPAGEAILDYSIYDALRAGFGRIVLVVRAEHEEAVRASTGRRFESRCAITYARQDADPALAGIARRAGRTKPWGTGHALLAAAPFATAPFAAINGDDFYGLDSFERMTAFLERGTADLPPAYAVLTFPVRDTLSDAGGVNRAVCDVGSDGWLTDLREIAALERDGSDARYRESGAWRRLAGSTLVSVNMWGFTPQVFEPLEAGFRAFLTTRASDPEAEYLLPEAMGDLIRQGGARVRPLRSAGPLGGLTYAGDRGALRGMILNLIERGVYPADLSR